MATSFAIAKTRKSANRLLYVKIFAIIILVLASALYGCRSKQVQVSMINDQIWGEAENKLVKLITFQNKNGMVVKITNYGSVITYIGVPDKKANIENVVLGFDDLAGYQADHPYFGSLIGRYANRIGNARFTLDGKEYMLMANDGNNALHGGPGGFHKKVFDIDTVYYDTDSAVISLSCLSPDMEEGYPGNLQVIVTYIITSENEIKIGYEAETDKTTVINLTNHSYFNLSACKENILNHELMLVSDSITPTGEELIPTGEVHNVTGSPFDFISPHKIGERIQDIPGGYDVNYKLRKNVHEYTLAAEVCEPVSGRLLQVFTTEPGIQFYSGNFLDGTLTGHDGIRYDKYYGLCLEAQHFPDSPNNPQFPDVILRPGERYYQLTTYKFSIR